MPNHAVIKDNQRNWSFKLNEAHYVTLAPHQSLRKIQMHTLQKILFATELLRQAGAEDLISIAFLNALFTGEISFDKNKQVYAVALHCMIDEQQFKVKYRPILHKRRNFLGI